MGLNGQTLTGSGSDSVIKIENGGSLTLADSGSGGKITRSNPMTDDGGGTFKGAVTNKEHGVISGGTFTEPVTNNEGGKITGGDFAGEITGSGDVSFSDSTSLYTVKFTVDGADCDKRCVTSTNIKISKPSDPSTKEGYTFAQWAMKDGKEWNFDKSIADNVGPTVPTEIALMAKRTINQCTVTFDTNGGSAVDPQTVDYDEKVTEPAAPTKTGYTFAGWYNGDKK